MDRQDFESEFRSSLEMWLRLNWADAELHEREVLREATSRAEDFVWAYLTNLESSGQELWASLQASGSEVGALDRLKLLLTDSNFLMLFAGAFGYMYAQGYADAWDDRWASEDGTGDGAGSSSE